MEKQKETSTSYTSTGGERGGGRRDSGDVEEGGADDNQRLNQDLVFSIDLVSDKHQT